VTVRALATLTMLLGAGIALAAIYQIVTKRALDANDGTVRYPSTVGTYQAAPRSIQIERESDD
jgi:hypothetical protein